MHIVIPMSGIGKRFIEAGYSDPKPLIVIDGKPIIEHVCDLFPDETKFTFICNSQHLAETEMRDVLLKIRPTANIVEIANHKKGPVFAVLAVQNLIEDEEEVIVNYCDFGTYWDYEDFLQHTRNRNADGAIPAYKGFHPHMLGTTNYAFMRDEKQWMLEIKEKSPFTDNRMNEYASSGTYYFKHGKYVKKYFQELIDRDINLNGEYYVSLVYNLLVEDNLKVSIYNIQHMLQWGTPRDVEEYQRWSKYFRDVIKDTVSLPAARNSINLVPLAGAGSRFSKAGYTTPKPLLSVSGRPMIVQAADSLPKAEQYVFVTLQAHLDNYQLEKFLSMAYPRCKIIALNQVTQGQAITCDLGLVNADLQSSLLIAATDNGMTYDKQKYQNFINNSGVDAIIFTFRNHPSSTNNPQMYGWVKTDGNNATAVSVKQAISATPAQDHAIVGTFYFRSIELYKKALLELIKRNITVNGEYYVDSLMGVLIDLGYSVKVFEVDNYICWGTPNDYRTFNYWQSFFHKAAWHPYSLENDPTVNPELLSELENEYHNFRQDNQ